MPSHDKGGNFELLKFLTKVGPMPKEVIKVHLGVLRVACTTVGENRVIVNGAINIGTIFSIN